VEQRQAFRSEFSALQSKLLSYTHMLTDIADVEDITDLESTT
jgi:hypothetical protein